MAGVKGPVLALLLATLCGCPASPKRDSQAPSESPQAKAEPAPLANAPTGTRPQGNAGPVPTPLRGDREVAADQGVVRDVRDTGPHEQKLGGGYAVRAVIRWTDPPPPFRGPEANTGAIEALRRRADPHLDIELTPGRLRALFDTGFLVPSGTELRARSDRYGAIALLPGEGGYHVLPPGAFRAFLGERRLDVAPVAGAEVKPLDPGRRLGQTTRRFDITTRAGRASVDVALFRDSGDEGPLLCRLLLDLLNAPSGTEACEADEIPVHAEFHWTSKGGIIFEATQVERRPDLSPANMATPSPTTAWLANAPAVPAYEVLLSRAELTSFRTGPSDTPATAQDARALPPESGLALMNSSDMLRVVWLDGVPVAWLAPGAQVVLPSLLRGRYQIQWRSYLGDVSDTPRPQTVPGTSEPQG